MKKKIITTIVTATLLATSFGIGNVQAADGDHTPRKQHWSNPTGHTTAYYEFDLVRALAKEDTKTALEAIDYWIELAERYGAYQKTKDSLNYYRDEIEKGVIHFHLGDMMASGADLAFTNLIQKIQRGELPRYSYVEYDKFHKKSDEVLGSNYGNGGSNDSTPTTPPLDSAPDTTPTTPTDNADGSGNGDMDGNLNENDTNTNNGGWGPTPGGNNDNVTPSEPTYKAPYGKLKPTNKYVSQLTSMYRSYYPKIELKIQNAIRIKLVSMLDAYSDEKLRLVMPAFDRALDKKIAETDSIIKKVIIEELKIQTKLEVRDYQ